MTRRCSAFMLLLFTASAVVMNCSAEAALPPEVRKELSELTRELRSVSSLIRRNEVDEAKEVIGKVEERLTELMIAEDERDRSYTTLVTQINRAKSSIPVSFEREVAPILKDKCLRCHGENQASANLRLNTYNNMGRGGRSGALLLPRRPQNSLIMARLLATDAQQRMPRGGAALTDEEINTIGRWIAGGAVFDGEDRNATIGDSMVKKKPPVKVVMADGSETVSFKEDVAPWMVNICLRCHSGNNPRGGYTMANFELLLTDGDTGSTVVPGDPDSSYIVDLVLRQDPIKMPAGNQVLLKRSQAKALETWIREGAHFDAGDPKAPLQSLVPTAAERAAMELANMTDAEFEKRRVEQAESIWKRVASRETAESVSTENLYLYGNASKTRLEELAAQGEEQVKALTERYKLPAGEKPWRGKLIVFVAKTRFDYTEFNTVLMNRQTPPGVSGHAQVTANFDSAYVAMVDTGSTDNADSLNGTRLLKSLLAQAWLIRDGANVPDWMQQGFGLLEVRESSEYLDSIPAKAINALSTLDNPGRVFDDGTFSPSEVGPVGYLVVRYLIGQGGPARFQQLFQAFKNGQNGGRAIQQVYGQSSNALGQAFLRSLR